MSFAKPTLSWHTHRGRLATRVVHEDDFEIVVIKYSVLVLVGSGPDVMAMTVVTQVSVSL